MESWREAQVVEAAGGQKLVHVHSATVLQLLLCSAHVAPARHPSASAADSAADNETTAEAAETVETAETVDGLVDEGRAVTAVPAGEAEAGAEAEAERVVNADIRDLELARVETVEWPVNRETHFPGGVRSCPRSVG